MYTYSVSIPHYNSPDWLARMLNSIPERDDIQVIVVDDGSSADAVEKLKLLKHKNLELVFEPENRGGGYARNAGLARAEGKWFISVDADDYFEKDAFDVFDKEKNDDIDVLMFCIRCIYADGSECRCKQKANDSVLAFLDKQSKKNDNLLRFRNTDTWNKLVSLNFIKHNKVEYENCRINIDVYYSLQIGLGAKKIKVISDILYDWVINSSSITQKKRTIECEFQFYLQVQKRNGFYKRMGLNFPPFYRPDILYVPFMIKKRGLKETIRFFKYRHEHFEEVKEARKKYLNLFTDKKI